MGQWKVGTSLNLNFLKAGEDIPWCLSARAISVADRDRRSLAPSSFERETPAEQTAIGALRASLPPRRAKGGLILVRGAAKNRRKGGGILSQTT
jgi:hypothetical protein